MIKNSTSFNNLNKYMIRQDPIKKKNGLMISLIRSNNHVAIVIKHLRFSKQSKTSFFRILSNRICN